MKFFNKIKSAKGKKIITSTLSVMAALIIGVASVAVYAADGENTNEDSSSGKRAEQVITIENEADSGLFLNDPIKGNVELTKVDAEYPENKLSGAEFEVYNDVDGDKKYTEGTDTLYDRTVEEVETGVYRLTDVRFGNYLIHETKAPEGFYTDNNYYAFSIVTNGETVVVENEAGKGFVNEPIKGTVKLIKADKENKEILLSGAEFEVYNDVDGDGKYNDDVDTVAGKMTETEKGHYELSGLRYGKYLVNESKAPTGYICDENFYALSVTGTGE